MQKEKEYYGYWLDQIPGIGNKKKEKLLEIYGSAKGIYEGELSKLQQIEILHEKDKKVLEQQKKRTDLVEEWNRFQTRKIQFVTREMQGYPKRLLEIPDPPYALYVRGILPPEDKLTVAIVGARECSAYGRHMAEMLSERLAKEGVSIISGMASGIDACAHNGSLRSGKTYAVLGCGVDICYPKQNKELYQKIWEQGGILSEYPPGTEPRAGLFPMRNRIISGLSDIVVVVEARKKSGSLITADLALEQGKEIYAVPGRCVDPLSYGCNQLIHQGAGVILSCEEFLADIGIFQEKKQNLITNGKLLLEKEEYLVYSSLDFSKPKCVEQIVEETGCEMASILEVLFALQEKGHIKEAFKNYYIRM